MIFKFLRRKLPLLLALLLCICFLTATFAFAAGSFKDVDELKNKKIGVLTGAIHDQLIEKRLPQAEIVYFNSFADMAAALHAGRIDSFTSTKSNATFMKYEDDLITWLDETLNDGDLGFGFAKNEKGKELCDKFSKFVKKIKADGTIDKLVAKWFGEDDSVRTLEDYTALPNENGTLRLATAGMQIPFSFVKDGKIVGFEIEIVTLFCKESGMNLVVEQMNFDAVLPSVQSGKSDIAASCLSITPERSENVYFSTTHYTEKVVFVVQNLDAQSGGFLSNIKSSFEKTFIRENRWTLFLSGIGTTLLISACAIIFGTLLGFALFMLCRNGNKIANAITGLCVYLVSGMPVVVLLMVLYYIIFGKVAISGTAVSVVGFTLIFASTVYSMMKNGVKAVDIGQTEAAYSLGYTNLKTFFRIILPQALPHFMPSYKAEVVSLIKATAIVGYVAVEDLTKVGDIIRSRTYEAFFPLIAVAVIYFILSGILTNIIKKIQIKIDPQKRSRKKILKGVAYDD